LLACLALQSGFTAAGFSQPAAAWTDPSPHTVRFITTGDNVRLEVLDFGGSGRPLVLLAGGGDTAHVFDDFAPKLNANHHVYAITRRGFGASGYADAVDVNERLGSDVLAVIDTLRLVKPILVGHSIAGAEMSWMANAHPDRISALVYLDAGYSYAFDNGKVAPVSEMMKLQAPQPPPPSAADLSSFTALHTYDERVNGFARPEAELRIEREARADGSVGDWRNQPGGALLMKLISNGRKFTQIPVPALFIFANPHGLGTSVDSSTEPSVIASAKGYNDALAPLTEKQEEAVQQGLPGARIITIPRANHYVYLSNQAQILREMSAFLGKVR